MIIKSILMHYQFSKINIKKEPKKYKKIEVLREK